MALAGIVAVTILVVVAFGFSDGPGTERDLTPGGTTTEATNTGAGTATTTTTRKAAPAAPRIARLVLRAARGDCWVRVTAGSPTGKLLFQGTIFQGQSERFAARRLWLEVGAGENLDVALNGRRVADFPADESVLIVTPKGIRAQS